MDSPIAEPISPPPILHPFTQILTFEAGSYRASLQNKLFGLLSKESYAKSATCPSGDNINQWIAVHMNFFCNELNLLYGLVQEKCTNYSCPHMSAGANYEYLLSDKYKYKIPTRVPAKTYVDYMLNWIANQLNDINAFPASYNADFSPCYIDRIKAIAKRISRMYAHIFYSHMECLRQKKSEIVYFDSLAYFFVFIDLYSLIPSVELKPLKPLLSQLVPNLKITLLLNQEVQVAPSTSTSTSTSSNQGRRMRSMTIVESGGRLSTKGIDLSTMNAITASRSNLSGSHLQTRLFQSSYGSYKRIKALETIEEIELSPTEYPIENNKLQQCELTAETEQSIATHANDSCGQVCEEAIHQPELSLHAIVEHSDKEVMEEERKEMDEVNDSKNDNGKKEIPMMKVDASNKVRMR